MVISASRDKSVRFWDVRSGQYRAVIEDYESGVDEITLIDACGINYLVAGCWEGSVGMWRVRTDEDNWDVSLSWMLTKGGLDVKDASIQDVQGLSQLNKRLLKQRGAVGEPVHRLREASKAVATMASVVSKLG
jgi:WD40 repeat protein